MPHHTEKDPMSQPLEPNQLITEALERFENKKVVPNGWIDTNTGKGYYDEKMAKIVKKRVCDFLTSELQSLEQAVRAEERERITKLVKKDIKLQSGTLRAGCPFCGHDLCACETGLNTAKRILETITQKAP
jgi:hypothetical protein